MNSMPHVDRSAEFTERVTLACERAATAHERLATATELLVGVLKVISKTSDKSLFEHVFGK